MAGQQAKGSSFAARLGVKAAQAHEAHKDDPVEYGNMGEMPGNVEDGIAQVVECKLGQYKDGDNKGKDFFYMAAVALEPKTVIDENGREVTVAGKRTSIMEALCETPGKSRETFEQHYAWVMNEFKKMQIDISEFDPSVEGAFEELLENVKNSGIYIKFRTWKGKKDTNPNSKYFGQEPRVMHDWKGLAVDYVPAEEATDAVEDNTETPPPPPAKKPAAAPAKAPPAAAKAPATAPAKAPPAKPPVKKAPPAPAPEPEPEPAAEEGIDLEALGAAADDTTDKAASKAAAKQIQDLALANGITKEQISEADNWTAVAALVNEALAVTANSEATEETATEGEWGGPEVSSVWKYKATVKGPGGKPMSKVIEAEVLEVDTEAKTCTLKSLADLKTIYKSVAWDLLIVNE